MLGCSLLPYILGGHEPRSWRDTATIAGDGRPEVAARRAESVSE